MGFKFDIPLRISACVFLLGVFLLGYFCVLLQAVVLGKRKRGVRNEMENGFEQRPSKP